MIIIIIIIRRYSDRVQFQENFYASDNASERARERERESVHYKDID